MANWTIPQHSPEEVDWAGTILIAKDAARSDEEMAQASAIIGNWRSAHALPLDTFQKTLRSKASHVQRKPPLVAHRIKRLPSIRAKLHRFKKWLTLSAMQDIGGCRCVVQDLAAARSLVAAYQGKGGIKHDLADYDDYVAAPKPSGYRGYHLIYKYRSERKKSYHGLSIEIQIRTELQHVWATAVETVGTFTGEALKASGGDVRWRRFFALMGSALARREDAPTVPGTPVNQDELVAELRETAKALDAISRLRRYATVPYLTTNVDDEVFLLFLDPLARQLTVRGFRRTEMKRANEQ